MFPNKAHIVYTINGMKNESIYIGDKAYYSRTNFNIYFPTMPGYIPTSEDTVEELERLSNLKQMPDEIIDGVECVHLRGRDKSNPNDVDVWIGRERLSFTIKDPTNYKTNKVVERTEYSNFNEPISIDAPL